MATPTENAAVCLPPSNTVRWSPQRKALVVAAVRGGVISLDEACRRYQLSAEEFLAWQAAIETHGIMGLHITRLRYFRGPRTDEARQRRGPGAAAPRF